MLNGDMFAFADKGKAYETLGIIKAANAHLDITIFDMCHLCQVYIQPELIPDPDDGWKRGTLNGASVVHAHDGYLICLPPKNIKEDNTEATSKEFALEKAIKEALGPNIKIYKENNTMAQYYNFGKIEVIKTQEEIELEEKIVDLKAEYDKKVAKLREEFKVAQEKRLNDKHSKEIHDKYQSLIDSGFTTEQAWEILKTMLGEFEL